MVSALQMLHWIIDAHDMLRVDQCTYAGAHRNILIELWGSLTLAQQVHSYMCTLSNQLDSPKSTAVVWAMKCQSAADAYLAGLSEHPPKKTAVACDALLWMTPPVWPHRAVNEGGNGICVSEAEEQHYYQTITYNTSMVKHFPAHQLRGSTL